MRHTEADRIAYNSFQKEQAHFAKVQAWLTKYPEVGVLATQGYYRMVDGEMVEVAELEELS